MFGLPPRYTPRIAEIQTEIERKFAFSCPIEEYLPVVDGKKFYYLAPHVATRFRVHESFLAHLWLIPLAASRFDQYYRDELIAFGFSELLILIIDNPGYRTGRLLNSLRNNMRREFNYFKSGKRTSGKKKKLEKLTETFTEVSCNEQTLYDTPNEIEVLMANKPNEVEQLREIISYLVTLAKSGREWQLEFQHTLERIQPLLENLNITETQAKETIRKERERYRERRLQQQ